jgi:hypothetical protein
VVGPSKVRFARMLDAAPPRLPIEMEKRYRTDHVGGTVFPSGWYRERSEPGSWSRLNGQRLDEAVAANIF